jgi:hypothetical protein
MSRITGATLTLFACATVSLAGWPAAPDHPPAFVAPAAQPWPGTALPPGAAFSYPAQPSSSCEADCEPAPPAAPGGRVYGSAEYLLWWINGTDLPPLVTTGPATFPVAFLGNPGTRLLFGGSSVDQGPFSGGQFLLGGWLGCEQKVGVEATFLFLGEQSESAVFNSSAFPVLARPFINANRNTPSSEFAAFPGLATGDVNIRNTTRLWGAGARGRCCALSGCRGRLDLLAGFQYYELEESLSIVERVTFSPATPDPNLAGSSFVATDRFATRNQFYGGVVGADGQLRRGPWGLNVLAQVALGTTHQVVNIQGQQAATRGGVTTVVPGGLLALPGANIGRFSRDSFTVIPGASVSLAYWLSPRLSVHGGYSFLYWSSVVRPGEQIDPNLDVNRIPNFGVVAPPLAATRPAVLFDRTDFWAHGVNMGLTFVW